MVRYLLNLILGFALVFAQVPSPGWAAEEYPYHEIGFLAGVFSGQTWVNLAPLVSPDQVISPQIEPVQFGRFLLTYDLLLKKKAKQILSVVDGIEGAQFRIWLEPISVRDRVRFSVKVEGGHLPFTFISAISKVVNKGQDFYPLRRAVYWFYKGRALRNRLGLEEYVENREHILRQAIGFLQWDYLKDWVGRDESLSGGIVLPSLPKDSSLLEDREFQNAVGKISKSSLIPNDEKTVILLKTAFQKREKGGLLFLDSILSGIENGEYYWLAEGLDQLAHNKPETLLNELRGIFGIKSKDKLSLWKDVKAFFSTLNKYYPRETGAIIHALWDISTRLGDVDVYKFCSLWLLEQGELNVLSLHRNGKMVFPLDDIETWHNIFPGLSFPSLAFICGYTSSKDLSWPEEKKDKKLEVWFYWGQFMRDTMVGRGWFNFNIETTERVLESLKALWGEQKSLEGVASSLIAGIEDDILTEQWILPDLKIFAVAIFSLMGFLGKDRLKEVLSHLSERQPGIIALLFIHLERSPRIVREKILEVLKEVPLSEKLFFWSLFPNQDQQNSLFVGLTNLIEEEVLSEASLSLVEKIKKVDQKEPLQAAALLDFLWSQSLMSASQMEELFHNENLSFETRLRAGLYWVKGETEDKQVLNEVWNWIKKNAQTKLELMLSERWLTDFRFIKQRWKTILSLMTVFLWEKTSDLWKDKKEISKKQRELLLYTLKTELIYNLQFLATIDYKFNLFHILNLMRYSDGSFYPIAMTFAHEIGHNISFSLLFPQKELGKINFYTKGPAALSELIADVVGIAFCELLGIQDIDRLVNLLTDKMLPIDVISAYRQVEVQVNDFNGLIIRYAMELSRAKGKRLNSFLDFLKQILVRVEDKRWLEDSSDWKIQDVYADIFSYLTGDRSFAVELLRPFSEALKSKKLWLNTSGGGRTTKMRLRRRITRREFLRELGMGIGAGAVLLGGGYALFKILREEGGDQKRPQVNEERGNVERRRQVTEKKNTRKVRSRHVERRLRPRDALRMIKKIVRTRHPLSKREIEEVIIAFRSLFDARGRLLVPISEFRRLLYWAGSRDVDLGIQLFEKFFPLGGHSSNLDGLLPSSKGIQEAKEITLRIVRKAGKLGYGYKAKIRFLNLLNRYIVREMAVNVSQDFFEFLRNPFWVYPLVLAQKYMAERGVYYDLDVVMAFAIKEGYDKVGDRMRKGQWRGVKVSNRWPMGLDRFGSRNVRKVLLNEGWLPLHIVRNCLRRTRSFMFNGVERFPLVRFVSSDLVLGAEYPALLTMISLIRQDQENMFRRFRYIKRNWDKLGNREKLYLLYLFYNSGTKVEREILTLMKDLIINSPQDLPGWLMRRRVKGLYARQHLKAVRTVAIAEALLLFLPRDGIGPGRLRQFFGIRKYLSTFAALGLYGIGLGSKEKWTKFKMKDIVSELKKVIQDYTPLSGEQQVKSGFVKAFKHTRFYSMMKEFSELVLRDKVKARGYFETKLFPILSSNEMQDLIFYDTTPFPRWTGEEKEKFVLRHLGDVFLYRLSAAHGFPNLRRKGVGEKREEDQYGQKRISKVREYTEDVQSYKERLWSFMSRWSVVMQIVNDLRDAQVYCEKRKKLKLFFMNLNCFVELAENVNTLDKIELGLAELTSYEDELRNAVFDGAGVDTVHTDIDLPKMIGLGERQDQLYLFLPISPSNAIRYGQEDVSAEDPVLTSKIKKTHEIFLNYGEKTEELLDSILGWDGKGGESWVRESSNPYLWQTRVKWMGKEEVPKEIIEMIRKGFKPVVWIRDSKGRFAFLVQEQLQDLEDQGIEDVLTEMRIQVPDILKEEWERRLFLGFLGIGRENIEFVNDLYGLGLDKVVSRVDEINSLVKRAKEELKSVGGIMLSEL